MTSPKSSIAIIAYGAASPLGEGTSAIAAPTTTRVGRDDELARAGLLRPYVARVPFDAGGRDRATVLFENALSSCMRELDAVLPDWRSRRVGAAIGTSSGGMRTFEEQFARGELPFEGTYLGPVTAIKRTIALDPFTLVLGACASSTIAIGVARSWLLSKRCDIALAGGFDAVSTFVAAGFESLRATTGERGPRPFREGRDGLALGEGAALVALIRSPETGHRARAFAFVTGFGASCDAVHLTAPDRTGSGLARAAKAAIADAGAPDIGLVSAHGTATDFNDAAEALAIKACTEAPVHALKGAVGHTLGAAGVLELLSATDALAKGTLPSSVGAGTPIAGVRIFDRAEPTTARTVLKLSSAFGGTNAALVASLDPRDEVEHPSRAAYISRAVHVTDAPDAKALATRTGYAEDKIARADDLVRLTMAAVAELEARVGSLRGAGIITGLGLATIDTNAAWLERIRERGAARGEPRRFPYTSPNAAGGECAVAFHLEGPMFAVGGGPHGGLEALAVAADLVATGVADRIVVVATDEGGEGTRRVAPETERGAVALLVAHEPLAARLEHATVRLDPVPSTAIPRACSAHSALTPLATERPEVLEVVLPWVFAKASLFWL